MHVERHAPSTPVLAVTAVLFVLALVCYFAGAPYAFKVAILAVFAIIRTHDSGQNGNASLGTAIARSRAECVRRMSDFWARH